MTEDADRQGRDPAPAVTRSIRFSACSPSAAGP